MMKKRVFSLLVALCLMVGLLPVVAFAAEEHTLPVADVEKLGATTYTGEYFNYDLIGGSGLSSANGDINMQIAMRFTAKDTAEQAAANYYANYTTDFFIEINGLAEDAVVADGCYLAGYYATFGAWVKIPLDGFTIENGKVYPVITSAGFDFKYTDICDSVGSFTCGIYFSDAFMAANPNVEVSLSLGLSENVDKALAAEFITVEEYLYCGEDFGIAGIGEQPEISFVDGGFQVDMKDFTMKRAYWYYIEYANADGVDLTDMDAVVAAAAIVPGSPFHADYDYKVTSNVSTVNKTKLPNVSGVYVLFVTYTDANGAEHMVSMSYNQMKKLEITCGADKFTVDMVELTFKNARWYYIETANAVGVDLTDWDAVETAAAIVPGSPFHADYDYKHTTKVDTVNGYTLPYVEGDRKSVV